MQDEQAAVRSSAVMAVAECVSALGPRCLPQLGPILDTVLQAAEASLAHLAADAASAADRKQVCYPASTAWLLLVYGDPSPRSTSSRQLG